MKQRIKTILYKNEDGKKIVCGTFSSKRKMAKAMEAIKEQFGEEAAARFESEQLIEDETYLED